MFVRKEINHLIYSPLICSVPPVPFADDFDYRDIKLGMTIEENKNLEIVKLKYMQEVRSGN